ncbi:MAG: hypothetical protein R3D62_09670 [Xanthobacteraceae bacterium]
MVGLMSMPSIISEISEITIDRDLAGLCRAAAGSSPQDHHRRIITAGSSPQDHHRRIITAGSSPQDHHRRIITSGSSPQDHHLRIITSGSSPQDQQPHDLDSRAVGGRRRRFASRRRTSWQPGGGVYARRPSVSKSRYRSPDPGVVGQFEY